MTRFLSVETLAETGYVTKAELTPVEDFVIDEQHVNRWSWAGDGAGAGELRILGDEQYIATIRATFQQSPPLRSATRIAVLDAGQLDIGVIDERTDP